MNAKSKFQLCALFVAALLLSACSPASPLPTGAIYPEPGTGVPTPASGYPEPVEAAVVDTAPPPATGQGLEQPAVAAAVRDLADRSGISPDQIILVSQEETEWPDGCLGIHRPGIMCTQAIVPGFRIILEADGVQYEYHTNLSGSQVALAAPLPLGLPSIETPADSAAAALIWVQIIDGVCQSAAFSETLVAYGVCGETPAQGELVTQKRIDDLLEFSTRYLPFEAETHAGKVVLNGLGDVTATAAEQRMLAAWAGLAAQEAAQGRSGASWGLVLDWRRVGGIAGVCQQVSIYVDGSASAADCRPANTQANEPAQFLGWLRLTPNQLEQLYSWQDSYKNLEWSTPPPLPMDGFDDQLVFTGGGQGEASEAELAEMQKLAEEIYLQLSTPQDADKLNAALAVLQDYLGALRDGRYADAAGLYTGSPEFMASMNPDLPADDSARLFERYCSQNGGVCNLQVRNVVHQAQLGADSFRFTVELNLPDGELFHQGLCCDDDQAAPRTQFDFLVRLQDGLLRVQTLPPYVP